MVPRTSPRGAWIAALLFLTAPMSPAQLVADFQASVVAGSNPLTVQFTDTTSGGTPISWAWDFGDGGGSLAQDPQHTFTAPGVYDVKLTAVESLLSSDTELKVALIHVAPAVFDADFSASATQGTNPFPVQFTDTSSGPITGWLWDFGDGSTSTQQHPEHVYSVTSGPALYTVSLTTFVGQQSETTVMPDLISVHPAVLVPSFTADVTSGVHPLEVQFSDTSQGPIDSWSWDLGPVPSSDDPDPQRTYFTGDEPTTIDITLTVAVGDQVATLTRPAFLTVEPAPVVVDFESDLAMGAGDATVSFSNLTTGSDALSWSWDFGDGTTSAQRDPVHTYFAAEPTRFDVTLTASVGEQVEVLTREAQVVMAPDVFGLRRDLVTPGLSPFAEMWGSADLDGDGDRDLLAGPFEELVWLPSLGSGSFDTPQPVVDGPFGVSPIPAAVLLEDLDGDGDDDVLISAQAQVGVGAPGGLQRVRNLGGGVFGPSANVAATTQTAQRLQGVDLDGDGDQDVLAAASGFLCTPGGRVWWHENLDGLGSLGSERLVDDLGCVHGLDHADIDADGDQDIVVGDALNTGTHTRRLRWLENLDGIAGGFAERVVSETVHIDPVFADLCVADLDGDGDVDLVESSGAMGWWPNDGAGNFPGRVELLGPVPSHADPHAVDVDGDGDLDVVARSTDGCHWIENLDGLGSFSALRTLGRDVISSDDVQPAAFDDIDGDGDLDVFSFRIGQPGGGARGWIESVVIEPGWDDLGQALAGAAGPPRLDGSGAFAPGQSFSLALTDALPGSLTALVVGAADVSLPFKGGVLVPHPDLLLFLTVGDNGVHVVLDEWPAGIAAGVPLFLQHWVVDGAAPVGLAASNGLRGVTAD